MLLLLLRYSAKVLSENASNKEGKEDTKIKIENLASYMLDVMTKNSSGFAEQFDVNI